MSSLFAFEVHSQLPWQLGVKNLFLIFEHLYKLFLGNAASVLFSTGFFFLPRTVYFLFASTTQRVRGLCWGIFARGCPVVSHRCFQQLQPKIFQQTKKDKAIAIEAECLRIILGAKTVGNKTLLSSALYNCILYVLISF